MRVVGVLREELAPAINWLKGVASRLFSMFAGEGSGSFAVLSAAAEPLIAALADGLIVAIRKLAAAGRAVFPYLVSAWGRIQQAVTTAIGVIRPILTAFMSWLGTMWSQHGQQIVTQATATWTQLRAQIAQFAAWAQPYVTGFMTSLRAIFSRGLSLIRSW